MPPRSARSSPKTHAARTAARSGLAGENFAPGDLFGRQRSVLPHLDLSLLQGRHALSAVSAHAGKRRREAVPECSPKNRLTLQNLDFVGRSVKDQDNALCVHTQWAPQTGGPLRVERPELTGRVASMPEWTGCTAQPIDAPWVLFSGPCSWSV